MEWPRLCEKKTSALLNVFDRYLYSIYETLQVWFENDCFITDV